ncbi:metallophosphoesterase [Agromyces seonyuensis]|uniref:Metallophosphoesterase n=1 Tax=Agromyces seonyuensis TaxID=2662446 RepID=A0A6I4NWR7_9MICO|nr:metallophosphoesterase [Agromyces seonyuensis]MWB98733.1 metallophosphoesterase [Agromyces seonyuensis]
MAARTSPGAALLVAAGALGAAALAWGTLVERNRFTVREADFPVLPAGAEPIRILHVSDLHMAPWQHRKQAWVAALAELEPDLVVDTGDNLGHVRGIEGIRAAFATFRGIPGVFVNGSNDYWGPVLKNPLAYFRGPSKGNKRAPQLDTQALLGEFAELGWLDLNNRAGSIVVKGTHLEFFGVDDPHKALDRLDLIASAIDDEREDDPLGDETWPDAHTPGAPRPTVTIGVAHAPYRRVLDSFVNHGAQVLFAGHTHGGQVCVPGFGALVTNCDIPRSQVKGPSLWRHGLRAAYLNVSAGLGTSIYAPVRFACPPEVSLITLTPAP